VISAASVQSASVTRRRGKAGRRCRKGGCSSCTPRLEAPALGEIAQAAESGATAVDEKRPLFPSLAALLAGHILRDGEVVLLILKPSMWHVLFSMTRFAAATLIAVIAAVLWMPPPATPHYVEAGVVLLAGRLMWSVLGWMGRLYVLTDQRILRLSGVFTIEVFDCPLRKVAMTRINRTTRERLFRLGSIEIIPVTDSMPAGLWQTIRKPVEVQEQIEASIRKARSGFGD
jgi:hypothetical protein